MYNHINPNTLTNEVRNRQSNFRAEAAQQRMVNALKQTPIGVSGTRSKTPRLLVETVLKIGQWLTHTPKPKEA